MMNKGHNMNTQPTQAQPALWSFGHVWLVISGPLMVVVASFISAFVAFQGNDTALQDDPAAIRAAHNMQLNKDRGMAPAMQARNHAATPVVPSKP
jgi:uncharacterized protein